MKKISEEERERLMAPFSSDEIKEMVFGMKKKKSPGPDGFPVDFYQEFQDLVKCDLKALIEEFAKGGIDISRLNYGIITLLPKTTDAKQIQKFKPICLLNVSFRKIVDEQIDTMCVPCHI